MMTLIKTKTIFKRSLIILWKKVAVIQCFKYGKSFVYLFNSLGIKHHVQPLDHYYLLHLQSH